MHIQNYNFDCLTIIIYLTFVSVFCNNNNNNKVRSVKNNFCTTKPLSLKRLVFISLIKKP